MKKKRRKFSKVFKEEAVKLNIEQGYPISEARNLGINATLLGRWKREYEDSGQVGFRPESSVAMRAELNRLRKENRRLKMEREILKKAAFFAKEQGWGINLLIRQRRYIP